jgi:hypothetical protein
VRIDFIVNPFLVEREVFVEPDLRIAETAWNSFVSTPVTSSMTGSRASTMMALAERKWRRIHFAISVGELKCGAGRVPGGTGKVRDTAPVETKLPFHNSAGRIPECHKWGACSGFSHSDSNLRILRGWLAQED